MKVKPLDKVICRTPIFGLSTTLPTVFSTLRSNIQESSPAFSAVLGSTNEENLGQLDEKARYTLWKYFNRARFRSTPFGSFASLTLVPLSQQTSEKIVISRRQQKSHFMDWSCKNDHLDKFKHEITPTTSFLSNSSFYFAKHEIRYLKRKDKVYELASVTSIPQLSAVLLTCRRKTEAALVYELMKTTFDMDEQQTTDFLCQLLDLQLLISDRYPNLIGEDYFVRMKVRHERSASDYIMTRRQLQSGTFDRQCLSHFPELINFLSQHLGIYESSDLNHFKQSFLKRFEHQEVSLALLLDPEIGIGYGNLAQQQNSNALVDEIKQARSVKQATTLEYGPLHAFLLNQLMLGKDIQLEDFKDEPLLPEPLLPNTFSFIFHLYQGQPVIAFGGGSTANSLIGRFTPDDDEMEKLAKEIAAMESNANPGIAFFDIAYQADGKIDNVNRHKAVYPHELPILSWSAHDAPLELNDIYVTVQNDEVILKSKQLGKRIVPRIPSAYNYTRSDLAVYRFLCDVKNQGLATQLSFRLQDFFPKLSFYPRLKFHTVILSPACWLIPETIYRDQKLRQEEQISILENWLSDVGIDFRFKSGHADATLCFDPALAEDKWAFLHFCRQQKGDVYISEALIGTEDGISDEHGEIYFPQYIVNFSHDQVVYQPLGSQQEPLQKAEHVQLPGGEWLYFELYSHAQKGNSILLNEVQQTVRLHQKSIRKWFFIRYNHPGPHIRLRIHLKRRADGFKLMEALRLLVEPEIRLGSINDFKIKTYFRETHRYGPRRMALVEQFFAVDSKCVLTLLAKARSEEELLVSSLGIIQFWLDLWKPDLQHQLNFARERAQSFDAEMRIGTSHFKKINANFNGLKQNFHHLTLKVNKNLLNAYERILSAIVSSCHNPGEENKLMADLIHMHVNRLFSSDQRTYETVIYHFLLRLLQMKRAVHQV